MLRIPNIGHSCDSIAFCLQRCSYVFPIVGGRKIPHRLDNINALDTISVLRLQLSSASAAA
ncbi:hypothetical protein JB92DRAFT_2933702, partial [Gautieria morchelliformis]